MSVNSKGNLLISYLQESDSITKNIDAEQMMKRDLQELAEKWKASGYINRYVIADDECISEKLKR